MARQKGWGGNHFGSIEVSAVCIWNPNSSKDWEFHEKCKCEETRVCCDRKRKKNSFCQDFFFKTLKKPSRNILRHILKSSCAHAWWKYLGWTVHLWSALHSIAWTIEWTFLTSWVNVNCTVHYTHSCIEYSRLCNKKHFINVRIRCVYSYICKVLLHSIAKP